MVRFSTLTTFFLSITFLMLFFSSCTITKRRYNSGFHIEWKQRERVTHSPREFSIAEQKKFVSNDTLNLFEEQIVETTPNEVDSNKIIQIESKSTLVKLTINQERSPQFKKILEKNKGNNPIKFQQANRLKRDLAGNIGLALLAGLLLVLFIPPLLFTIVRYGDDPNWTIAAFWIIWIVGILTIALLLSNIWAIIGLCIAWNVIFSLVGSLT